MTAEELVIIQSKNEQKEKEKQRIRRAHRNSKPSKNVVIETMEMLQDFCIDVDVPNFDTVNELLSWRSRIIRKYL